MQIPLILGAVPKLLEQGPLVPVKDGLYKVIVDGLVDSKFEIHTSCGQKFINGEVALSSTTNCFVQFMNVGSEKLVSVYLRRM